MLDQLKRRNVLWTAHEDAASLAINSMDKEIKYWSENLFKPPPFLPIIKCPRIDFEHFQGFVAYSIRDVFSVSVKASEKQRSRPTPSATPGMSF